MDPDEGLFFKPDFVELVGRYMLLLQNGDEKRLDAFIQNRQEATTRGYKVGGSGDFIIA